MRICCVLQLRINKNEITKDKYCPVLYRVFDGVFAKNKNFYIQFTKQTRRENMVQMSIVFTRKCIDSIWKFC